MTADKEIRVQTIIDNYGTVHIWKDADSKQEVFRSAIDVPWVDQNVNLKRGYYSVVVDSIDTGVASGIVFTALDPINNTTIKKSSGSDGSWCMFRRKSSDPKPTSQFVQDVASCRSCLVGD